MKRVTIICGHYGSGKTTVAVELARKSKAVLVDMDIVNPYYRAKDFTESLAKEGIKVLSSEYANSNVDIPALPKEIYAVTDDRSTRFVLDVGGDDRGALALGRLAPALKKENDFEMIAVINMYRPLTRTAVETVEVMREIEAASGLQFTAIVNNSNLGKETTAADVLKSVGYAEEVSRITNIKEIKIWQN